MYAIRSYYGISSEGLLTGSETFAKETGLKDGQSVTFTIGGIEFERLFKIDTSMKGSIALNPTFDMGLSAALISSYRFSHVDFATT